MTESLGKGIATAGIWIGVGLAATKIDAAVLAFAFATLGTFCVWTKWG